MDNRITFGNDLILSAEQLKENNYYSNLNSSLKYIFQRNAIHNAYYGSFHLANHFAERVTSILRLPSIKDTSWVSVRIPHQTFIQV